MMNEEFAAVLCGQALPPPYYLKTTLTTITTYWEEKEQGQHPGRKRPSTTTSRIKTPRQQDTKTTRQ
ncbi:MAG: hypothetical protein II949_03145 [Prevotella sp.]|nr:hypothetical protein [Prevotella sp.]